MANPPMTSKALKTLQQAWTNIQNVVQRLDKTMQALGKGSAKIIAQLPGYKKLQTAFMQVYKTLTAWSTAAKQAITNVARLATGLIRGAGMSTRAIGQLKNSIVTIGRQLQGMASVGSAAFGSLFATLKHTTSLANPAAFQAFERAMADLGAVVGQILTPVLEKVTAIVRAFADRLINLDDSTKATIASIVEVALVVTGVAKAASVAAAGFSQAFRLMSGAVTILKTAMAALTTGSGGLLLLIGGLAAAAFKAMGGFDALGGVTGILKSLMDAFKPALEQLQTIFSAVADAVKPLIQTLGDAFLSILSALIPAVKAVANAVGSIMRALAPLLKTLADMFTQVVGSVVVPLIQQLAGVIEKLSGPLGKLAERVISALQPVFDKLAPALKQVVNALMPLIPPLMKIAEEILEVLVTAIEQVAGVVVQLLGPLGQLTARLIRALQPAFNRLVPIVEAFTNALIPLIPPMTKIAEEILEAWIDAMGPIVDAIGKLVLVLTDSLQPIMEITIFLMQVMLGIYRAMMPVIKQFIKKMGQDLVFSLKAAVWIIKILVEWLKNLTSWLRLSSKGFAYLERSAHRLHQMERRRSGGLFDTAKQKAHDHLPDKDALERTVRGPGDKSSVGAAAGKAEFTGLEEFGRKAHAAALQAAGGETLEKKALRQRDEQLGMMQSIRDAVAGGNKNQEGLLGQLLVMVKHQADPHGGRAALNSGLI